ncbi:MAG: hypothetical protein JJU02_02255 [Cryomorphaceae bacterium]|nr:hypothetical protein [Cryomorphaceae bacterium]
MSNTVYRILLTIIILLSFFTYGGGFFPLLNADQGIYCLMARHFTFSNSLYYWGQDRLGSFLPMLAAPFTKLFPAIWVLTVLQIAVSVGAWYYWSRLVAHKGWRLLLACAILLPPIAFSTVIIFAQPYHVQLLLWGAAFFLLVKGEPSFLRVFGAAFLLVLSIWLGQTAVVTLPIMGLLLIRRGYFAKGLLPALFGAIPPAMLILAAKNNSAKIPVFSEKLFVTWTQLSESLLRVLHNTTHAVLSFSWLRSSIVISNFSLVLLLFFILFISVRELPKAIRHLNFHHLLLYFGFWGLFLIGILSFWVYLNDTNVRYFSMLFVVGVIFAVLWTTEQKHQRWKKIIGGLTIAAVLGGSADALILVHGGKTTVPHGRMSNGIAKTFPLEPGATYIGDYWNVMVLGAWGDASMRFFSHQAGPKHNMHQLRDAFQGEPIYLLQNSWLESFPDTISQYHRPLERDSEVQNHESIRFARYRMQAE